LQALHLLSSFSSISAYRQHATTDRFLILLFWTRPAWLPVKKRIFSKLHRQTQITQTAAFNRERLDSRFFIAWLSYIG